MTGCNHILQGCEQAVAKEQHSGEQTYLVWKTAAAARQDCCQGLEVCPCCRTDTQVISASRRNVSREQQGALAYSACPTLHSWAAWLMYTAAYGEQGKVVISQFLQVEESLPLPPASKPPSHRGSSLRNFLIYYRTAALYMLGHNIPGYHWVVKTFIYKLAEVR